MTGRHRRQKERKKKVSQLMHTDRSQDNPPPNAAEE
jgi:hypothetical protein